MLPCPFCGSPACIVSRKIGFLRRRAKLIPACTLCNCEIDQHVDRGHGRGYCVAAWNNRVKRQSPDVTTAPPRQSQGLRPNQNTPMRAYKITPSPDTRFDSLYVLDHGNDWKAALSPLEECFDEQYSTKDWTEIKVTVECVELTQEQWDEIQSNTEEWTS
jgi:hypothetical protein